MKIIRDLENLEIKLNKKTAITIGKYDGIHRGHQELLKAIINKKSEGFQSLVFTFDPSPAVFFGISEDRSLMTLPEKRRIFDKIGVDILVEYPLNNKTAAVMPEAFVRDILIGKLNCGYLAAGQDISFGHRGQGDAKLLRELAEDSNGGLIVDIIPKILSGDEEISSSRIKKHLILGDIETVNGLIGYPYCVTGEVVRGKRLGSKLGMPTLNIIPDPGKLLPPAGVYFSYVSCGGVHYDSITNIGYKPTVTDERIMGLETYLYDFEGDLYGEQISVNLLKFSRAERKFDSVEELKAQMERDLSAGREYHKEGHTK